MFVSKLPLENDLFAIAIMDHGNSTDLFSRAHFKCNHKLSVFSLLFLSRKTTIDFNIKLAGNVHVLYTGDEV